MRSSKKQVRKVVAKPVTKSANVKQKMLSYLKKSEGYNTFSTKQAQSLFGIKNVSARVAELRSEGHAIYLNTKTRRDGTKVGVYRLGKPSKSFRQYFRMIGVKAQPTA